MDTEWCEREKPILRAKFGKPSELSKEHIKCQCYLSHRLWKSGNTFQSLRLSVAQKEIKYVWLILEKLPASREDLVRRDNDWKKMGLLAIYRDIKKTAK